MFKLAHKYVERPIPKSDYIRYTPQALYLANRENAEIYNDIPRKDAFSLKDS